MTSVVIIVHRRELYNIIIDHVYHDHSQFITAFVQQTFITTQFPSTTPLHDNNASNQRVGLHVHHIICRIPFCTSSDLVKSRVTVDLAVGSFV